MMTKIALLCVALVWLCGGAVATSADRFKEAGIPSVLMHGVTGSSTDPKYVAMAQSIRSTYGVYSVALNVSDGDLSWMHTMDYQVNEFVHLVRSDPNLRHGFNLLGFSQGALLARAYIERYNDPPVFTFVSVVGPLDGVSWCPKKVPSFVCEFAADLPFDYDLPVSFAGYFKDVRDKDKYLNGSKFLADINNERPVKNATYRENMIGLRKFVMVKALNDTIVYPNDSEFFSMHRWGEPEGQAPPWRETETYLGDWVGLQTLDRQGKVDTYTYEGDHMKFSMAFWNTTILPYLGSPSLATE